MRENRPYLFKLLALILSFNFCLLPDLAFAQVANDGQDNEARIDKLTNTILHKEIDLERYYLKYRALGTQEPKYRRLRFYLLQTASAAVSLSSSIMFLREAYKGLNPGRVNSFGRGDADPSDADNIPGPPAEATDDDSPPAPASSTPSTNNTAASTPSLLDDSAASSRGVRNAFIAAMVGTILDGSSSLVELSSNTFTYFKNKRNGNTPNIAVNNVIARIKEIDALIKERQLLIEQHPDAKTFAINKAEGEVLVSFRDWCLSEFADVYADVKSTQSSTNIYYLADITADTLYVAALILGLKALEPMKGKFGGPATTVALVGDAFGVISAPASYFGCNLLWKYWRKRLKKRLDGELENSEDLAKTAMDKLNKEMRSPEIAALELSSVRNRISLYLLWSARYDLTITKQLADLKHQSKVALQGEISGPLISSTYLTQDLLANIAFYRYPNVPKKGASLAYAGSVVSTAGCSTSLFLTNYNLFNEWRHKRRLRKKNALPEQLLAERLKTLDELDALLDRRGSDLSYRDTRHQLPN